MDPPRDANPQGLTSSEAARRLQQFGPNEVPPDRPQPWLILLAKFWAPVPWMLELAIVLEAALHKWQEATVIGCLLLFNAGLSLAQEQRANSALAYLRRQLDTQARALRDGTWQRIPARDLVPDDVVHIRMGDLAPADVRVLTGGTLLDQSSLTGEAAPVDAGPGALIYAGSVVRRGEATGTVTGTGVHTYFGKTTELVRTARTQSHLERVILTVVQYLVGIDVALVAGLLAFALLIGAGLSHVAPFALILLVASVPVALPATFTLAAALGAMELARSGVLVSRLSAIEEAASMDVLATDKTGTLTENRLTVTSVEPYPPYSEDQALRLASLASDESTQDPLDMAILAVSRSRGLLADLPNRTRFEPFDSSTKRSEAEYSEAGRVLRVLKGAVPVIAQLVSNGDGVSAAAARMAANGLRVLAVAAGAGSDLRLVSLLAFQDPPRADARALVERLRALGIRVVMITGDDLPTARAIGRQLGIGDRAIDAQELRGAISLEAWDVAARVLPEDKFRLVETLQKARHVTGMTGDGVNDAPALKQAEVGIAVESATDVARLAASIALTNPGLNGVETAVTTSRRIFQRMRTYTLNMAIKKCVVAFFLTLGYFITRQFVVTPLLIVLWVITNDFVTMAIATDRTGYSPHPDRWRMGPLMATVAALSVPILALCFAVYFFARDQLRLPLPQVQTLTFVLMVYVGQGVVYLVRERDNLWSSRPSLWLALSSVLDIALASTLAGRGVLMAAVPLRYLAALFIIVAISLLLIDFAKVAVERCLERLYLDGPGPKGLAAGAAASSAATPSA